MIKRIGQPSPFQGKMEIWKYILLGSTMSIDLGTHLGSVFLCRYFLRIFYVGNSSLIPQIHIPESVSECLLYRELVYLSTSVSTS